MGYSINVDWIEEFKNSPDKWINHGRAAITEACKHKTQDKDSTKENRETNMSYSDWCDECGESEDSAEPMMNYAYPLHTKPDEERILQVVRQTCLTVMENTETGEYFLALCGGGMDLSQDIALAYILAEGRIPYELAIEVSTQAGLSQGGKQFRKLMRKCKAEIEAARDNAAHRLEQIEKGIQDSLRQDKEREARRKAEKESKVSA